MRILHVVTLVDDSSSYGGPLTVAINQCTELIRRGHDARILAGWRGEGQPPKHLENVPAYLFPVHPVLPGLRFSSLFSIPMTYWLYRSARAFDVAHIHAARDLVPLVAAAQLRRAGVPYTTQTHGMVNPDQRRTARVLDRFATLPVLRAAGTRFVLTDAEEDAVIDLLDGSAPVTRLANGIALPAQRNVPDGLLDVLFLARLHPRKHVLDFARAALTLLGEGINARFSVCGPDDGDLPALAALIERAQPGRRLRYEGPLPHEDAMKRLREAAVFVLPSVDEPFPMTLLEALANGVPSICTSSCGLADDLRRERAALVIEPGERSLTTALRQLIADPQLRDDLAARAVEVADRSYSVAAVGDVLLRTYAGGGHNA